MEPLIGFTILGLTGWGAYKVVEGSVRSVRHRRFHRRHSEQTERHTQRNVNRQQQTHRQLSEQNGRMQLAILHLDRGPDPDFRRAASAAQAARAVPLSFRQRQYHRLRPLLVQHYRRCQARGATDDVLMESLTELVEALGMQEYEADYIRQEVERRQTQHPTATGNRASEFQQRLTQSQQEHDQRQQAIRSLANITDEIRDQLLEAEEQRYQAQLFGGREG